jgi:hypothetical protein
MDSNPEAATIPFGKFCGMSLSAVLVAEPTYLLWLLTLREVQQKHPDVFEAIIDLGPELLDAVRIRAGVKMEPKEVGNGHSQKL